MKRISLKSKSGMRRSVFFTSVLAFAICFAMSAPVQAQFTLVKISSDSFTDNDAQHKTEVEPDTYSWGSTMVASFQVARISPGGGADLGFSTSTNGGQTWTFGSLPGWTVNYKHGHVSAAGGGVGMGAMRKPRRASPNRLSIRKSRPRTTHNDHAGRRARDRGLAVRPRSAATDNRLKGTVT